MQKYNLGYWPAGNSEQAHLPRPTGFLTYRNTATSPFNVNASSIDRRKSSEYLPLPASAPSEFPCTSIEMPADISPVTKTKEEDKEQADMILSPRQPGILEFHQSSESDPAENSNQAKPPAMSSIHGASTTNGENVGTQRRLPFRETFGYDTYDVRKAAGTVEVSPENSHPSLPEPVSTFVSAESARKRAPRKSVRSKKISCIMPVIKNIGQSARYWRGYVKPRDEPAAYAAAVGVDRSSNLDRLPLMPEVQKLEALFQEVIGPNGQLPKVSSFPVEVVRSYLHDRVFGVMDGSKTLTKADAEVLTRLQKNTISRGELREELLKVIDSMIEEITGTNIHKVCESKSMKRMFDQKKPLILLPHHPGHPLFNHFQRILKRAGDRLHNNIVEFESKMAGRQAQSDQEQPPFWFDQNPNDQLHTYPLQGTFNPSQAQSASQSRHPVTVIGQGRQSSVHPTNNINQSRPASTLQPTTMDQTQPSSTYPPIIASPAEDDYLYQTGTVDQGRQSSTNPRNAVSHAHLSLGYPTSNVNQSQQALLHNTNIVSQGQQPLVYPTVFTQPQPSYGYVSSNISQNHQGYIGQDQPNSTHPQNLLYLPPVPYPGYNTLQYPQQQAPLFHVVSDSSGQFHIVQVTTPQAWNPYHQSAQVGPHIAPMYSQPSASTFSQPVSTFQPPTSTFQQPPSTFHPSTSTFQQPPSTFQQPPSTFQQPPSTFQQSAPAFQQTATAFQQTATAFLPPASVYSGYSQAPGQNSLPPPMPVPLQGMRPAAHQRLAPLILRSGSFGEQQQALGLPTSTASVTNFSDSRRPRSRVPTSGPSFATPNTTNTEWHQFGGQVVPGTALPHTTLPYGPGSQIMYPPTSGGTSQELQFLVRNGRPSVAMATDRAVAPFAENAKGVVGGEWGVLRVANIPYSVTRQEVRSFLGRNANILTKDVGPAIHIIMDRATGKTMDCYVEFFSTADAIAVVDRMNSRGRPIKLGHTPVDRVVSVEMSSQEALMKELFPRAKNVNWPNGKPEIYESDEPYNTGFKCFITGEELVMLVKHAEQPHRSNFTQKCPQRTYECLMSILAKFPWYSVENYTITTRNQLFAATRDQLRHLITALRRGSTSKLDMDLVVEVMTAGLNAPGFSERQRWELMQAAEYQGTEIRLSPLAEWWPWEALGRKANVPEDLIEFYAHLMTLHPSTINTLSDTDPGTYIPFGRLASPDSPDITMATALEREWERLYTMLDDLLPQP